MLTCAHVSVPVCEGPHTGDVHVFPTCAPRCDLYVCVTIFKHGGIHVFKLFSEPVCGENNAYVCVNMFSVLLEIYIGF